MLQAFDHMEAQQFARGVLTEMGLTHLSEVFPNPSDKMTARLRECMSKVIQTADPVQRAAIFRLSKDREYRSLVCPKKN